MFAVMCETLTDAFKVRFRLPMNKVLAQDAKSKEASWHLFCAARMKLI